MDLFTTSLKLAGADVPKGRVIDGVDIRPLLFGTGDLTRDAYFYYHGTRLFAVRQGQFKAHFQTQGGYRPKPEQHNPPLLFNLGVDPGESFNVAPDHPDVLTEIVKAVERHNASIIPVKNQLEGVIPDASVPAKK